MQRRSKDPLLLLRAPLVNCNETDDDDVPALCVDSDVDDEDDNDHDDAPHNKVQLVPAEACDPIEYYNFQREGKIVPITHANNVYGRKWHRCSNAKVTGVRPAST
eukprot:TRINITY_DN24976_c0_g1_i1.p1 TRINITY_DN24976_c0_g1~~TRINITY_DN24976_c0_g1_i1.p1  ORF type:complete len:105 (+),score=20.32 TRINITY_DN24976_c0_g1_i1:153-467(+)